MTDFTRTPVELSDIGQQAFDVVAQYTFFPGPLMLTQLKRHGLDPVSVDAAGLSVALEDIVTALERFTSPAKAKVARDELLAIIQPAGASAED